MIFKKESNYLRTKGRVFESLRARHIQDSRPDPINIHVNSSFPLESRRSQVSEDGSKVRLGAVHLTSII